MLAALHDCIVSQCDTSPEVTTTRMTTIWGNLGRAFDSDSRSAWPHVVHAWRARWLGQERWMGSLA